MKINKQHYQNKTNEHKYMFYIKTKLSLHVIWVITNVTELWMCYYMTEIWTLNHVNIRVGWWKRLGIPGLNNRSCLWQHHWFRPVTGRTFCGITAWWFSRMSLFMWWAHSFFSSTVLAWETQGRMIKANT